MSEASTLTREQLYDLVWSTPLSKLATHYEISDVGLAKICRRLDVPRPPVGYWAASKATRNAMRTSLSMASESGPALVELKVRTAPPQPREVVEVPGVTVRKRLASTHRLLSATTSFLEGARITDSGLFECEGCGLLDISVSPARRRRALRIADALVRALEARGHDLSAGENYTAGLFVGAAPANVRVRIRERLTRATHVMTAKERARELGGMETSARSFDFTPKGQLAIELVGDFGRGHRHSWRDGKRATLEEKLGHVVVGIESALDAAAKRQQEWIEIRKRRAVEAEAARQREVSRAVTRQRVEELRSMASQWEEACRIRDFVHQAEKAGMSFGEKDGWADWARSVADEMDPITRR